MTADNKKYLLVTLKATTPDELDVHAFAVVSQAYFTRTKASVEQLDAGGICLDIGIDGTLEWESADDFLADIEVRALTAEEVASLERIFPAKDKTDDIVAEFGFPRFLEKVRENLGIGY
jgi:tryptophanase